MRFECARYVPKNKNGKSEGVGVWWREAEAGTEWCIMKLGEGAYWGGILLILLGIMFFMSHGLPPFMTIIGVVLIASAFGLSRLAWRVSGDVRAIEFLKDGTVHAPDGLSTWARRHRRMNAPHGEISTFEWEQLYRPKEDEWAPYTHGVMAVLRDGSICRIARNLEPENARQLVVLLTHALAEMRVKQAAAQGGPINIMID